MYNFQRNHIILLSNYVNIFSILAEYLMVKPSNSERSEHLQLPLITATRRVCCNCLFKSEQVVQPFLDALACFELSQFGSSLVRSASLQGMKKIKEVLITIESMHIIPLMADTLNYPSNTNTTEQESTSSTSHQATARRSNAKVHAL
jgi:hypothetical protein